MKKNDKTAKAAKWMEFAAEDLRKYGRLKASLKNIAERIEVLESEYEVIRDAGGNVVIENRSMCERLKLLLLINKKRFGAINKGLASLTKEERMALKYFYIKEEANDTEKLRETLDMERSALYRLKDEALRKFAINMFGLSEYVK